MPKEPLTWHEIESGSDPLLVPLLDLYEQSFPTEVMAPRAAISGALDAAQGRDAYRVAAAVHETSVVGGTVFNLLPRCQIGFLSYIFASRAARGQGVGKFIYNEVVRALLGGGADGLLFEIERPDLATTAPDQAERTRRLRFFTRMGARVVEGLDYLQPPLHPTHSAVRMHLMLHQFAAAPAPSHSAWSSWLDEIYESVYRRGCRLDRHLLRACRSRIRVDGLARSA